MTQEEYNAVWQPKIQRRIEHLYGNVWRSFEPESEWCIPPRGHISEYNPPETEIEKLYTSKIKPIGSINIPAVAL